MDTMDGMRTFAAVAMAGSFTRAADQLGISGKLASKYIGQLEARLGAQLLHRTTRSVTLTEIGEAYLVRCRPLLDQFDELESIIQTRQSELAGSIRLTAPTGFGSTHLTGALQTFMAAHPNVSLDVHLSDHQVSIVEEGFDLAIRFGTLASSTLVARKLAEMRVVCCAAPDYLAARGRPEAPGDLVGHDCLLQTTSGAADHWPFHMDGTNVEIAVIGRFRANSPLAVANMAAGGLGIARVPFYTVEPFLADARLAVVLAEHEAARLVLHGVYPPGRHLTARVRALIDHLTRTFRNGRAAPSGSESGGQKT
ncbi:MAG: LysR family transcriptional regulator [Pseudomonadota bacterium]